MSGGWGAQPEEASQPALKKDPEPSLRPGPVGPVPALGLWQRPVQVQVGDGSPHRAGGPRCPWPVAELPATSCQVWDSAQLLFLDLRILRDKACVRVPDVWSLGVDRVHTAGSDLPSGEGGVKMEQVTGPGEGAVPGPGLLAAVVRVAGTVGAHGSLWSQVICTWEGVRGTQRRRCPTAGRAPCPRTVLFGKSPPRIQKALKVKSDP